MITRDIKQFVKKLLGFSSIVLSIVLSVGVCNAVVISVSSIEQFDNLMKQAIQDNCTLVVDFFAPWCGPCKRMAPIFENFSVMSAGRCVCIKVDTEQCSMLAHRYGISRIPTIVFFKQGSIVNVFNGVQSEAHLMNFI
jgi:thioredoxin